MKSQFERALAPIAIPGGFAGSSPISLPAVHYLLGINLRLSVTCTGNTAIHTEALARSITIRYKYGSSPSVSIPGHVLLHRNTLLNGIAEDYTEIPAGAGPNVGTWNTFIPRAMFHRYNPLLTMDDMSGADDPTFEIVFGGITTISKTGGAAITAITCVATAVMMPRAAGPRTGRILPHALMNVAGLTDLVASTADQIRRIRSGYRNSLIMFIAENNSPAATDIARSDALITAIEPIINLGQKGKINWTDLRTRNRAQAVIAPATGVTFLDYDPSRYLRPKELLDLRGIETMEIGVDSGPAAAGIRLWVYQEELVDPDNAARKALGLGPWE